MAKSVDLKLKLHLAAEALVKSGPQQLWSELYSDAREPDEDPLTGKKLAGSGPNLSSLADKFHKQFSGKSKTTSDVELFNRLGCSLKIEKPDLALMECTAVQFFTFLPDKFQQVLRDRMTISKIKWISEIIHEADAEESNPEVSGVVLEPVDDILETFEHPVYRSLTHNFSDKTEFWLTEKVVDQKFMYLSLHSVENWRSLIAEGEYKPYRRCVASLKTLLQDKDSAWEKESTNIGTVVIFGAGTPSKESLIIENLLKQERFTESHRLRVMIVDASPYMLVDTEVAIRKLLTHKQLEKRVDVTTCWGDFNHMEPHLGRMRQGREGERVAFFLMGGTIGNIDEGKFLSSVHDISQRDDLLIVSAEFYDKSDDFAAYLEGFEQSYSGDSAKDLVLEPIRRMLDLKHIAGDITARRAMVKPTLVQNDPSLGSILGTIAMVLRLDKHGINLALSRSKRYKSQAFLDFFEKNHFRLLTMVPCATFAPYHQMMFVREHE